MLKNYLITAVRNLMRQKGTAFINITGLTLGITSSLILFLLIKHELSYDTFHANKNRIYRVVHQTDGNGEKDYSPGVPPVLPDAFKNDFNEAEEVTFTTYRSDAIILIPQANGEIKKYSEKKGVAFAEPNFFKIFDRKILIGNAQKGLDEPNEAIISRKLALKYFGVEDAIGRIVNREGKDYRISALMEDLPSNTDFPFDLLLSYITIKKENEEVGWRSIWSDEQCYFLLKEGANLTEIERRIPAFVEKYLVKENPRNETFLIQPLTEIHFDDRFGNYNYNTISKQMLLALGIIAVFLILTAAINFVNLTTAEAIKRSKEVGIRKTMGGTRSQLVRQFLGETSLVTIFSMMLALGIAQLALGFLNPFLELSLYMNFSEDYSLWIFLIGMLIIVSTLSGLYPSLVVSGFKPALALKKQISGKNSSGYNLRRSLVVLQFFISQFFIIGTIILILQMNYFQKKELGFQKDAIINIPIPEKEKPEEGDGVSKMRTLRNEVSSLAGVEKASLNNTPPSSGSTSNTEFKIEGNLDSFRTEVKLIDGNYFDLFKLEMVAGIDVLDLDTAQGFIVNERLAVISGYINPSEIIGKKIKMWGKELPIVGVAKDFHTVSLHEPIEPTIMLNRIRNYETLSIKLNSSDKQETIKKIQEKWEAAYPNFMFSYDFLDDQIKKFYEKEARMSTLLTLFTSMAIFIGCLGLFGLATFMANQKTKEIGIRKVLGASIESIIVLFSKEYVRLILIGFALAAPVSWYVMTLWLNEFAYKINISPLIFLLGLGVTLLIAIITVGYRSLRAATVNPVDSLRSE